MSNHFQDVLEKNMFLYYTDGCILCKKHRIYAKKGVLK